ncbi:MAG: polysaccharide deacetylase family protein [Bacteroidetes bacterium]|nr:polysaccharide deacetylase family protein [Bacteroidota bacterium]
MYFVTPPYVVRSLSKRNLTWKINTSEKVIYLTFDDGPIPEVTTFVLKQLEEFDAKATFFCVGDNVRKYPEIFETIINANHAIGNHSYNHLNGWKSLSKDYLKNIQKCDSFFETNLFRPPYGKISPMQILKLKKNYSIVLWSVLSYDFDIETTGEKCLENVISHSEAGSIVVFHDSIKASENLFYALPKFLKHFSDLGFEFRALTKEVCESNNMVEIQNN